MLHHLLHHPCNRCFRLFASPGLVSLIVAGLISSGWNSAKAHELWTETSPNSRLGAPHEVVVCWGHFNERASGEAITGQHDKISTRMVRPDGSRAELKTTAEEDCFVTTVKPEQPGYFVFGSELQTGILSQPLHSIPPKTRIIMYGKTLTHVAGSDQGMENKVGFDMEIVPRTPVDKLHPGKVVEAKVLLKGKPLGGRDVEISLVTPGKRPLPEHPRIQSHVWSIDAVPDPNSGHVAFPLITTGPHLFVIRHFDESPGTYTGPHDFHGDFSHLQKGDAYERTMYISTLMLEVAGK
ncbi:MAG: DUF4198 domain-containing protein [Planctomycetota bacterium]